MTWDTLTKHFVTFFVSYGPKLLTAAVIFLLGWVLMRVILRLLRRGLTRSKRIDVTMHTFILSIARIAMIVALTLICMDLLGIPSTPLITALGAVGLAVSLAVKDSLANLLGGSLLLISKPFAVGDYCDVDGLSGSVSEIGLIYTTLNTIDNKRIFIPNGQVANAKIVNYSSEEQRRLDLTFSIGYHDDFPAARALILETVEAHPMALREPAPLVRMSGHGDHSIQIVCRVWVSTDDYWTLNFDLLEQVKAQFDAAGVNIPYPQMDVHLKQQ